MPIEPMPLDDTAWKIAVVYLLIPFAMLVRAIPHHALHAGGTLRWGVGAGGGVLIAGTNVCVHRSLDWAWHVLGWSLVANVLLDMVFTLRDWDRADRCNETLAEFIQARSRAGRGRLLDKTSRTRFSTPPPLSWLAYRSAWRWFLALLFSGVLLGRLAGPEPERYALRWAVGVLAYCVFPALAFVLWQARRHWHAAAEAQRARQRAELKPASSPDPWPDETRRRLAAQRRRRR